MTRPKLLELFSCASGAGMGYHCAGFDVTAVDIEPQPNNPFEFIQADALELLRDRDFLGQFDAVHASPTCQRKARVTAWRGRREDHPNTLTPTLRLLRTSRIPWVVENVPEAADELRPDYLLCGTQFGLPVRRHRIFEIGNWAPPAWELLPPCHCRPSRRHLVAFAHKDERRFADAMGCTWMTAHEGRQAIPPAYTEHIGRALIDHLREAAA